MLPFRHYSNFIDIKPSVEKLKEEIPFVQQEIINGGVKIKESRLTCWMSDQLETTLEYSGKSMLPIYMTSWVKKIRDIIFNKTGIYFDSVLVNYYENGSTGMRYHSDPLGNGKWCEDFFIISIGSSRKIVFRQSDNFDNKYNFIAKNGDAIHMFDDCQTRYQHSVRKDNNVKEPRISLVFKKKNIDAK